MTVRRIDPPLHEFMPALIELETRSPSARPPTPSGPADEAMLVESSHQTEPMGLRGVRLGIYLLACSPCKIRALCEAADLVARGLSPRRDHGPLVGSMRELQLVPEAEGIIASVAAARGVDLSGVSIGAMIRAAARRQLTARPGRGSRLLLLRHQRPDAGNGASRATTSSVFFPQSSASPLRVHRHGVLRRAPRPLHQHQARRVWLQWRPAVDPQPSTT